ncbi:hypothetical protein M3Y99_01019500 [Aphelenchoides fujianensis]|nr:hypothetical protein M3Y99_01019500 [Aphelenchoides fujianensis]
MSTDSSQCRFFLQRQQRNCANAARAGHHFCSRHLNAEAEETSREVTQSPPPSVASPSKANGRKSPAGEPNGTAAEPPHVPNGEQPLPSAVPPPVLSNPEATKSEKFDGYSLWLSRAVRANDWTAVDALLRSFHQDAHFKPHNQTMRTLARRLQSDDLLPLLKIAASVLTSSQLHDEKNAVASASTWFGFVADVLQLHTSELAHLDDLDEEIGDLIRYVEARKSSLDRMLRLQGKLAFLLEQAEERNDEAGEAPVEQAGIVFEDGDSDAENLRDLEQIANKSNLELFEEDEAAAGEERKSTGRKRRSRSRSTNAAMETD